MSNSREKNQPPPPNLLANNSQVISDRVPVRPLQGLSDPVPSVRPVQRVPPFGEGVFRPHIKPPQQENAQGPENTAQPAEITAKVTGSTTGQAARQNSNPAPNPNLTRNHERKMTEGGRAPTPDSVDPANPVPERRRARQMPRPSNTRCRQIGQRISVWRTGTTGGPLPCRISSVRRRGCRGSGSPPP